MRCSKSAAFYETSPILSSYLVIPLQIAPRTVRTVQHFPVRVFQTRTLLSNVPDTIFLSGSTATETTSSVCPERIASHFPDEVFQIRIVLSSELDTILPLVLYTMFQMRTVLSNGLDAILPSDNRSNLDRVQ